MSNGSRNSSSVCFFFLSLCLAFLSVGIISNGSDAIPRMIMKKTSMVLRMIMKKMSTSENCCEENIDIGNVDDDDNYNKENVNVVTVSYGDNDDGDEVIWRSY